MAPDPVIAMFAGLRVWKKGGERAPHKPLLVLLALGRWVQGERGPFAFGVVEKPLARLLTEFGPPRRGSPQPALPFWHLQTDGVWQVTPASGYPPRKAHTSPTAKQLRDAGATGEFTPVVCAAFARDPARVVAVARALLDAHFPPSAHEDVLAAVGLEADVVAPAQLARDRAFREAVLVAYRRCCVVCGYGVRLGDAPVGVEAAHIRWHASGGPDTVANGLCLCSLHHKLFDRGALTLSGDGERVLISEQANGRSVERVLGRYHGRRLPRPNRADAAPGRVSVRRHRQEGHHQIGARESDRRRGVPHQALKSTAPDSRTQVAGHRCPSVIERFVGRRISSSD